MKLVSKEKRKRNLGCSKNGCFNSSVERCNQSEVNRQLVHLLGILLVPASYILGKLVVGITLISGAFALFFLLEWGYNNLSFTTQMFRAVRGKENLRETPFYSGIVLIIGTGLIISALPINLASIVVIVIMVSDSTATLVGLKWGHHYLPINKNKTWEGFFSGLASSLAVLSLLLHFASVSFIACLLVALSGSIVEGCVVKGDDNLAILIVTSFIAGVFWFF